MTTLDKVLKDMEKLKHEKDFYEAMNECHVKMIDRQAERVQELTELVSILKTQKDDLESIIIDLKAKIELNEKYGIIASLRDEIEKTAIERDNYEDMVKMKKKQTVRMTYRIEELENENETLKYNLEEMARENYKFKKRCNDLAYGLKAISNYCSDTLVDEEEE